MGGILRSHLPAWHQITDNAWVLQCIQGYHLEFGDTLPQGNWPPKQPPLSPEQTQILDQEILSLLQKNAIESAPGREGFFSPMFTVPKKDGGWRPIINLKRLNTYLEVPHFKMEGINTLKDVLQKNDFMGKIDLKDAYLTVPVSPHHRKFLKFQWKGQNYQFKSLPFGLATAPRVFTKILRPLAAKLRKQGIRIVIYLDDILIMAQSKDLLRSHMRVLAHELECLGFKLNQNKCVWTPTQTIEYLGFLINSVKMTISLPDDKLHKIKKECRHLYNKRRATARELAHLIGLLSSTIPAVSVAPLHYRALQRLRHRILSISAGNYDHRAEITEEAKEDLIWWMDKLQHFNDHSVVPPSADMIITTDASKSGWGATDQAARIGGAWTMEERTAHINFLEMKAVQLALQTFVSKQNNIHILLLIDNSTTIAYINHKGGTHSKALSNLALNIWDWCVSRRISLHAEHIPGVMNLVADAESRKRLEPSDWMLDQEVFHTLHRVWGPFDIDLFAARHNTQLSRYFSFKPDPGAEAVDALAQTWTNFRAYAFPPFLLIGRCLRKLEQDQVKEMILIVPFWHNQSWFPTLLARLIDIPLILPNFNQIITNPKGETHQMIAQNSLTLVACKVSGIISKVTEFQMTLSNLSPQHGEVALRNLTLQHGENGFFGAIKHRLIPCRHLSDLY